MAKSTKPAVVKPKAGVVSKGNPRTAAKAKADSMPKPGKKC